MAGIESSRETLKHLLDEVAKVVVGQRPLIEGLLIGLLSGGHVLVEGVPGLAKTTAVRTLAEALGLGFGRVQFTPDLLPGDLTGNTVFVPDRREFTIRRGPIFTPVLLADEINRAPAKVQSALLEAMAEGQVSIGEQTLPLPEPFFVMATQNPIELAGTYPLPEAQLDRFLLKLVVPYPSEDEELEIVARDAKPRPTIEGLTNEEGVLSLRRAAALIHVADEVRNYAVRIVRTTRTPEAVMGSPRDHRSHATALAAVEERREEPRSLALSSVSIGASPRASLYLVRAARARALLEGRDYATPDDVKRMAPDVLRHRILISYEAEADGITPEAVVDAVLASVETP